MGQQPFGGARASGTNDKAGSMWNLIRWASPRVIKETLVPPTANVAGEAVTLMPVCVPSVVVSAMSFSTAS